ncbi:nuclease [Arthrobacter phage Ottawa]|nr:nuclease [Arthrobacter phage Kharcho]WIC89238.1 nuclease [Arthrobacter phage Ottawa]
MRPEPNHVHRATVIRWRDGDTVKLDTDQDYETFNKGWHRLIGVDTPSLGKEQGKAAHAFVEAIAPPGTPLIIVSYKAKNAIPTGGSREKYGRWLAEAWLENDPPEAPSINQRLLTGYFGVAYFGGLRVA